MTLGLSSNGPAGIARFLGSQSKRLGKQGRVEEGLTGGLRIGIFHRGPSEGAGVEGVVGYTVRVTD